MYHDNKTHTLRKKLLITAIVLILLAAAVCFAVAIGISVNKSLSEQAANSVKVAVLNAAVQSYAVEGACPTGLKELEKSCGLQINKNRFIVIYDAFASNLLPEITVLTK